MSTGYESNYPASGYASETRIRTEFSSIEDALNDTVSRTGKGTASNAMKVDLDLDGNDLLNAGSVYTDKVILKGTELTFANASTKSFKERKTLASGQLVVVFENSINNATFTAFTSEDSDQLHADVDYTFSDPQGNTITLTSSYPAGTVIEMTYYDNNADAGVTTDSLNVAFSSGTGTVDAALLKRVFTVNSVEELAASAPMYEGQTAYLAAGGRSGKFVWTLGDFSAEVAADTLQGVHVASDTIAATVGCWVRSDAWALYQRPEWYGVSTAAEMQIFSDGLSNGETVLLASDISLDSGFTIGVRSNWRGDGGLLTFTADIADKAAIKVTADGCELIGVRAVNPNKLGNRTQGTARPYGIEVEANEVLIQGCHLELFQNPIAVRSTGEWYNIRVIGNRCKDCLGAGDGPSDLTSLNGEDRGDGITIWGAQATVSGNIVNLLDGEDGRVGIHAEALSGFIVDDAPHNDALISFTGNIVYGKFRRGIVNEGISAFSATGNVVADSTWWGLCMIQGAKNSTMSANTVIWTRTSSDNQGDAWNPLRGPMMLYGDIVGCGMSDNTVIAVAGSEMASFARFRGPSASEVPVDCGYVNNRLIAEDATVSVLSSGIMTDNFATRPKILHNVVRCDATRLVYLQAGTDAECKDNTLTAFSTAGTDYGILTVGDAQISGNTIANANVGIGGNSGFTDGYIKDNDFVGCNTRITGFDAAVRSLIYNNQGQRLYYEAAYNPASIAAGGYLEDAFTVTGAALGDFVSVSSEASLASLVRSAYVQSADTVAQTLFNPTGSAVDRPSADIRILVEKIGNYV